MVLSVVQFAEVPHMLLFDKCARNDKIERYLDSGKGITHNTSKHRRCCHVVSISE